MATQRKATPGPWRWWTSNSFRRLSSDATGKDGDVLCAFVAPDGVADVLVNEENAALIAAAPELYAALRELREAWCLNFCDAASPDEEMNHLPECYAARDALAKADADAP